MSTLFATVVCASNRSSACCDIARLLATHGKPFNPCVRLRNPASPPRRENICSWDVFDRVVGQVVTSESMLSYDAAVDLGDGRVESVTIEMLGDRFPISGFRRPGRLEIFGGAAPFSLEFSANAGILGNARYRLLREWRPIKAGNEESRVSGSDALLIALFMFLRANELTGMSKLFVVLEDEFRYRAARSVNASSRGLLGV